MTAELLVRYLHFIGIILLSSMLVAENILFRQKLDRPTLSKLVTIDGLYGLGAVVTLVGGLLLWFAVGKPAVFYSDNIFFLLKVGLFVFIGILSAFPAVFLIRHRSDQEEHLQIPRYIVTIKRVELCLLLVLPLLAVLMARGIGLSW